MNQTIYHIATLFAVVFVWSSAELAVAREFSLLKVDHHG